MITLLNTSILTNFGTYEFKEIKLEQAQALVYKYDFQSAIGHKSTAEVLSSLLGVSVPFNRMQYSQQIGETALVFKLKDRPEEGKILSVEEIESIGYEFGILTRIK